MQRVRFLFFFQIEFKKVDESKKRKKSFKMSQSQLQLLKIASKTSTLKIKGKFFPPTF